MNYQLSTRAPVIIVAYNRAQHFKTCIDALAKNIDAEQTTVFIYLDGPKNTSDAEEQVKIKKHLQSHRSSFRNIHLKHQDRNVGLSNNITSGITEVLKLHETVVVLEDDIVVAEYFLRYMNQALAAYESKKEIWHIASHTLENFPDRKDEVFTWGVMNCWGWATWRDRWDYFKKDPIELIQTFTLSEIYEFDLRGTGTFWTQVLDNYTGKMDTWAVFWYATIFKNNGLCVNPYCSFSTNIGFDGSGTHCRENQLTVKEQKLNNVQEIKNFDQVTNDIETLLKIRSKYISQTKFLIRCAKITKLVLLTLILKVRLVRHKSL